MIFKSRWIFSGLLQLALLRVFWARCEQWALVLFFCAFLFFLRNRSAPRCIAPFSPRLSCFCRLDLILIGYLKESSDLDSSESRINISLVEVELKNKGIWSWASRTLTPRQPAISERMEICQISRCHLPPAFLFKLMKQRFSNGSPPRTSPPFRRSVDFKRAIKDHDALTDMRKGTLGRWFPRKFWLT